MRTRCINIDWLEFHVIEPDNLDADYYAKDGWVVEKRPYGTRVYDEMFTLMEYSTGLPLIEIRRSPVGNKSAIDKYVIDPHSCHIRLCNRTCYYDGACKLLWDFIQRYGYFFCRISRIDICLDFERFDKGDDPQKFINRYLKGRYSKINQGNIRANGKDMWDGRFWQSLAWGAPKSMISTKLYNKTVEIAERKDKPYIRQAWAYCGLVDDFIRLTKRAKDGTEYSPQIWRLEFSIQSSVKRWFRIEDNTTEKKKIRSIRNTPDMYFTREQLIDIFASLVNHYFHFKKDVRKNGQVQRKDRCPDKELFDFTTETQATYKVERVASSKPASRADESLRRKLEMYRLEHINNIPCVQACETLLKMIANDAIRSAATEPWNQSELTLLRQLISYRVSKVTDEPVDDSLEKIKALIDLESDLFGEKR